MLPKKRIDRDWLYGISILGVIIYGYFSYFLSTGDHFGTLVYNYYYISLSQGQFDVPVQIIGFEGHYDASGRAFVYHGLAPLITRLFADPFVDLTKVSLSPFTVWIFACAGTFAYNLAFVRVIGSSSDGAYRSNINLIPIVSVMVWFISPGLIIAANQSLYHEPIAVAYFTTACFITIITITAYEKGNWLNKIVPLSLIAGVTVFARPNVAVGLYAAVCLLMALCFTYHRRGAIKSILFGIGILGGCGSLFLAVNAIRFGNPLIVHGGLTVPIDWGFDFFGLELLRSESEAFSEYGRFNLRRVIPNLLLYFGDIPNALIPDQAAPGYYKSLHEIYANLTVNLGHIRNYQPAAGLAFIWMPWFAIICAGAAAWRKPPVGILLAAFAAGIIFVLIASFGTVTFRYRIELWPLIACLSFLTLPGLIKLLSGNKSVNYFVLCIGCIVVLLFSASNSVLAYVFNKTQYISGDYDVWSYEKCAFMVEVKSPLSKEDVPRVCTLTAWE